MQRQRTFVGVSAAHFSTRSSSSDDIVARYYKVATFIGFEEPVCILFRRYYIGLQR